MKLIAAHTSIENDMDLFISECLLQFYFCSLFFSLFVDNSVSFGLNSYWMKTHSHMEIQIFYIVCIIVSRTEGFAFTNYSRFMSASYYRFRLFTQIQKKRLLFCIMSNQWFLVIWKCSGRHSTRTSIAFKSFHTYPCRTSIRLIANIFFVLLPVLHFNFPRKKFVNAFGKRDSFEFKQKCAPFFFSWKTNSLFFITQNNLAMNIKARALEYGKVYGER